MIYINIIMLVTAVTTVIFKIFYYKERLKQLWLSVLERLGINIFQIYDENFVYYTKSYYLYLFLSKFFYKNTLDNYIKFPNGRFTVQYLCSGNFVKCAFPCKYTVVNYIDIYYEICWRIYAYNNQIFNNYNTFNRVYSVSIDNREYKHIIKKYIPLRGMYSEKISLAQILYDSRITSDSNVVIVSNVNRKIVNSNYKWDYCKYVNICNLHS